MPLTLGRVAFGGALGESAQGDLGLHGRVALQTLHGDQVHVVERQFAQFRHLRLDEERRFRGVETHREVVQRHFDDILTHLFRVVGIVGERLRIGDHNEYFVELARVLQLDAAAERTHEVAQMEPARGTVAGKDDFCHIFRESTFCRRRYEKLCGNAKKLSDIDFFISSLSQIDACYDNHPTRISAGRGQLREFFACGRTLFCDATFFEHAG